MAAPLFGLLLLLQLSPRYAMPRRGAPLGTAESCKSGRTLPGGGPAGRPAGKDGGRLYPGRGRGMAARLFLRRGSHGGGGLGCILVGFCSRVPRLIGLLLFGLRGESELIWRLALKMRFFLLSTDAWERTRQLLFLSVFLFLKNGSHQSRGTSFRAPGRRIIRSFGLGPFGP